MSDGDYKQHHAVFVCKPGRGGGEGEVWGGGRRCGEGGGGAEETVMSPTRRMKRASGRRHDRS